MQHLNKILFIAASLFAASCAGHKTDVTVSVVPKPVSMEQYAVEAPFGEVTTSVDARLAPEEYILKIRKGKVSIKGGSDAGVFWGEQTLAQIHQQCPETVPNLTICDKPEFAYRGAHLDCCRHFWAVDEVKTFIDLMAIHKLNTFHWHLAEDQGWRFESKKYPKLTEIAAWRSGTMIGREWGSDDGIRHGGFYTQEEMKDVVAYASGKFITVIPEIEMPGHATAALAAYPELGCTGGPYEVIKEWGVFPDIFCVGKDKTIQFLKDILDEVCEIFPSEYIHIGGDEAPRTRWESCPDCQARIKAEGLENEAQLQSWLNNQIETYLNSKGRKIIGWDEILEGGVTRSATVMSWRGPQGGKAAAAMGNDVVMTPNSHYYFDYYQTAGNIENGEPLGIGGHVNLEKAFSFNPYEDLDDNAKVHIKGIQANMWTEYISEFSGVLYRELPRIAALSEVAWNFSGKGCYKCFVERVKKALLPIYEEKGWPYADFAFRDPAVE